MPICRWLFYANAAKPLHQLRCKVCIVQQCAASNFSNGGVFRDTFSLKVHSRPRRRRLLFPPFHWIAALIVAMDVSVVLPSAAPRAVEAATKRDYSHDDADDINTLKQPKPLHVSPKTFKVRKMVSWRPTINY